MFVAVDPDVAIVTVSNASITVVCSYVFAIVINVTGVGFHSAVAIVSVANVGIIVFLLRLPFAVVVIYVTVVVVDSAVSSLLPVSLSLLSLLFIFFSPPCH